MNGFVYRLGRHRRRNLYYGPKDAAGDSDVFVALFDDPGVAEKVMVLLNRHLEAEEQFDWWTDEKEPR